ncbi:MAG TPA: cyanophycinase [Thermoanaerobaculaceae bacterium]|nr:cyanophycinase [Thermoanaerobaculaceae bacterium]HRS16184.1 cyanophycinase [Thermoanaerobaculaceae bacterium]
MLRLLSRVAVVLWAAVAAGQAAAPGGHLVLIGGGEKPPEVMRKFVELAGGPAAPIVAIPTASSEPDTGAYYVRLFKEEYSCTDVVSLEIRSPADARRPEYVELASRARGIFFSGGDQVRILTALARSPVLAAISAAFARGAVVGGTSAGTACQSPLMITGEGDFSGIRSRSVELWDGLGFFSGVIVDQHFIARQRQNRLFAAILEHPEYLGVGIDEDTAVWVRPDGTFEVLGRSSVMVVDASTAKLGRQPRDTGQDGLGAHGVTVHVLLPGEVFDLKTRSVFGPTTGVN